MIVLARYLNKRLIELYPNTEGETVGVLRKDGTYAYRPWRGLIDRERAMTLGRPVKLHVARVGHQGAVHVAWRGQGCLTPEGAYAVTDWNVRLV